MPEMGFFIKNIIIIGDPEKNGEYTSDLNLKKDDHPVIIDDGASDPNRADRIVEQIRLIAETAKKVHLEAKQEQLTRAITDEFNFYTKNTPLTLEEYKYIINNCSRVLSELPPNIVLIISSMPIEWPDGKLRNAVLHIQSPNKPNSDPIIHQFSKESVSFVDPHYSKDNTTQNLYEFFTDDYLSPYFSPDVVLSDTKVKCHDSDQYRSAIIVRGVGLPPIIDAIDVCFDHRCGIAKKNTEHLLKNNQNPPFHLSHIITSNTVLVMQENLQSTAVHADRSFKTVEGVDVLQKEPIETVFGQKNTAYIYEEKRSELIHSNLFDIAVNNTTKPISTILDADGNTLLHETLFLNKKSNAKCTHYRRRLVSMLKHFSKEAINQKNKEGNTPLHLAVQALSESEMLINFLLQGARITEVNAAGKTPIALLYQQNKVELIEALCNKIVNTEKIFIFHREHLLALIEEVREPPKRKLAIGLLNLEIRASNPNAQVIIRLLNETQNPHFFIHENIKNMIHLSSQSKKLYDYLIAEGIFIKKTLQEIKQDSPSLKANLIKQELTQNPISQERIDHFIQNLSGHANGFNELEYLQLTKLNTLFTNQNLSAEEKEITQAYLTNNHIMFQETLKKNPEINLNIISNASHPNMAKEVRRWLQNEQSTMKAQQNILHELKQKNPNQKTIIAALDEGIHLNDDCALGNNLSIGEEIMVHAGKTHSLQLLRELYVASKKSGWINSQVLDKINNKFPEINDWLIEALIKIDPIKYLYQELQKGPNAHSQSIIKALELGSVESRYKLYDKATGLTFINQVIAQAFINQDPQLLQEALLHTELNTPTINKIALSFNGTNNPKVPPEKVMDWINQFWLACQPELYVSNAITYNSNAEALILALEKSNVNINKPYAINLSIGERLIFEAYVLNSPQLLKEIHETKNGTISAKSLKHLLTQCNIPENKLLDWINQALVEIDPQQALMNEVTRDVHANHQIINAALSKPGIQLDAPCGFDNGLTLGEQLMLQAINIYSGDSVMRNVYLKLKQEPDLEEITLDEDHFFYLKSKIEQIKEEESIKTSLKAFEFAHRGSILDFLKSKNCNSIINNDCGFNNQLTVGQQILAYSFMKNDKQLIQEVINLKPLNKNIINKIAVSFDKMPNSRADIEVVDVKNWLYNEWIKQELEQDRKIDPKIILEGLTQAQLKLNVQSAKTPLNLAEQIIAFCSTNKSKYSLKILEQLYSQISETKVEVDVKKIAKTLGNDSKEAVDWINQEIDCLKHQEAIKGLLKSEPPNLSVALLKHLPPNIPRINLNAASGLKNGLTLGEQILAQTFLNHDRDLLNKVLVTGFSFKNTSIKNVSFFLRKNNTNLHAEDIEHWIEKAKPELKEEKIIPNTLMIEDIKTPVDIKEESKNSELVVEQKNIKTRLQVILPDKENKENKFSR